MNALQFEGLKVALKQDATGYVLTLKVHPNEIPEELVQKYANFKGDQRRNLLSHWIWRAYASPVWMDIRSGRLLPYQNARESTEEKHVCPLQLDVIERCLTLWSNPGDVVLTPFLGCGSEAYMALQMGRKAIGCELKPTYYRQAVKNLAMGELPKETSKTLFDAEHFDTDDSGSMDVDDDSEGDEFE
jgi:DNA modification methylase